MHQLAAFGKNEEETSGPLLANCNGFNVQIALRCILSPILAPEFYAECVYEHNKWIRRSGTGNISLAPTNETRGNHFSTPHVPPEFEYFY